MRSSLVVRERLTANAPVATVLGSIPASAGTVKSEVWGAADGAVLNIVRKKNFKKSPKKYFKKDSLGHKEMPSVFFGVIFRNMRL